MSCSDYNYDNKQWIIFLINKNMKNANNNLAFDSVRGNFRCERIINLTDVPTEEALRNAEWHKKIMVKVRSRMERIVAEKTEMMVKWVKYSMYLTLERISRIMVRSSLYMYDKFDRTLDDLNPEKQFEKTFSEKDLMQFCLQTKWETRHHPTYTNLSVQFPCLSKRQIWKIRAMLMSDFFNPKRFPDFAKSAK